MLKIKLWAISYFSEAEGLYENNEILNKVYHILHRKGMTLEEVMLQALIHFHPDWKAELQDLINQGFENSREAVENLIMHWFIDTTFEINTVEISDTSFEQEIQNWICWDIYEYEDFVSEPGMQEYMDRLNLLFRTKLNTLCEEG